MSERNKGEREVRGFCTKYVITVGILPCSGVEYEGHVFVRVDGDRSATPPIRLLPEVDFFEEIEAAEDAAIKIVNSRLKSLRAQAERMEGLLSVLKAQKKKRRDAERVTPTSLIGAISTSPMEDLIESIRKERSKDAGNDEEDE